MINVDGWHLTLTLDLQSCYDPTPNRWETEMCWIATQQTLQWRQVHISQTRLSGRSSTPATEAMRDGCENLRRFKVDSLSHSYIPRSMECRRGLAMRSPSVRLSVRLSICLSVKRVDCDKKEEQSVQIFIAYERTFSLVFWEKEWLVEGATYSTRKFRPTGLRWSEIANFEPIFARA